jgi:hypothetical protein
MKKLFERVVFRLATRLSLRRFTCCHAQSEIREMGRLWSKKQCFGL